MEWKGLEMGSLAMWLCDMDTVLGEMKEWLQDTYVFCLMMDNDRRGEILQLHFGVLFSFFFPNK